MATQENQTLSDTTTAEPLQLENITVVDNGKLKKAITAAALGNAMEWFDFGVYGFVAFTLGKVFFPNADPGTQTIAALATFSVPFLVRPLGGLFFGVLGDKLGRQKVLSATIILMAISTFCIGLIPGYATIGIWAPILLLVCKLAQGFSVGGEYTGAAIFVAEYAPDRRRGFLGSWLDFGSIAGFLLGAGFVVLLTHLLGEASFTDWGWRIPFLIALPLGIIGLYLRHAAEETPAFTEQLERMALEDRDAIQDRPMVPFREIFAEHRRSLMICIGMVIATNVTYYMLLTYMPTYLTQTLGYGENHGLMIIIVVMIGLLFGQPLIGFVSDKIGRKPFLIAGSIGLIVLSVPAFHLITTNSTGTIFLGLLILAILLNCMTGIMASTLPSLFPARIRYSALALSFNISIIIAGLTPTISAWLVEATRNVYMPGYYLMLAGVAGLVTAFYVKETANRPLYGDTPTASTDAEAQVLLEANYDHIEQRVENVDDQIVKLEERLDELKAKKQTLIDQHPHLD